MRIKAKYGRNELKTNISPTGKYRNVARHSDRLF